MSDASYQIRAQRVEILAHVPAPATSKQTHCSVRRYAFEIPIGKRANFHRVTCLGVKQCEFALRSLPDGFVSHVAMWVGGWAALWNFYRVGSFLGYFCSWGLGSRIQLVRSIPRVGKGMRCRTCHIC